MIQNYVRPCIKCGSQTVKQDTCYKCRSKKGAERVSRATKEAEVEEILSMSKEDAKKEYEYWNQLWISGDTSETVRYHRAQMRAIIQRENINVETLI